MCDFNLRCCSKNVYVSILLFNGEFKRENKNENNFTEATTQKHFFKENVSNLDEVITLYLTFSVGF